MKNTHKITVLFLIVLLACIGVVSAVREGPRLVTVEHGTAGCSDVGCVGFTEFKIDGTTADNSGTVTLQTQKGGPYRYGGTNGFWVDITVQPLDPSIPLATFDPGKDAKLVSWESSEPVSAVITKDGGGTKVYLYTYDPAATSDKQTGDFGGVQVPANKNNFGAISHLTFCYGSGVFPPPTPVPEFPTLALPVGMMIGFAGMILLVKSREN
jgi:hypothetical protein